MEYKIANRMSTIQGSIIREIFKSANDPEMISLAGGNPAPETFPSEELADIAYDILKNNPVLSLQYSVTEGYEPLKKKVRQMLKDSEGIDAPQDQVMILSGAQQCMDLCSKILINPGDTIIVEEPSFIGSLNAFRSFEPNMVGVPMDEDGMRMDALRKAIEENNNVKFIYTIPTFQNPSGITMSLERRKELYEIALENQILIIEDNPYAELTFDGSKLPTLKSMDIADIVIYAGSFSKILSPGMRLGFTLAPAEIVAKMTIAKQMSDVHTGILNQLMADGFIERYDIYEYIARARKIYGKKCAHMLKCMEKYFPPEVKYTHPTGGLFIWATMPSGYNSMKVSDICAAAKVAFVPGNAFAVDMNKPSPSFRLNYSSMDYDKIEEGIRILGETLTEIMNVKSKA
ncbi:MAG: PLP-dependent aminotransferase family protein [Clostridiales bacterium]|nr:PLP-dependent aminotransferase family protein [Clostridiales bacterium]